MAYKWRATRAGTLVLLLGTPCVAGAQVTALVTTLAYQSPALVAPVVLVSRSSASGADTWTLGLTGYTANAEWTKSASPNAATVLRAEVTPWNANSSQYVYRNGDRASELAFRDGTVRLGAGLRLRHGGYWRTEVRVAGLYESLAGVADSAVAARWSNPYVGLGVETSYQRVVSDDRFRARWDGLRVSGSAEGFVGSRTWWRSQLAVGEGRRLGPVILRGRGWVLLGHNLDLVNRHLVGGSWDLAGAPPLYGYHYAEFRVDRGVVLGGGADLRLGGDWELGLRIGYLNSPAHTTRGGAVRLGTVWNGIGVHVGVGLPRGAAEPLIFAGVNAATLR